MALVMAAAARELAAGGGGFGTHVGSPDLYSMFLPRFRYVADTLRTGHFPLWNPFELCGLPLHGTSYGMALYAPMVLANLVLPPLQALRLTYVVHIWALSLFTLLYLRRTGIGLAAGIVGVALATSSIFNGAAKAGPDQPYMLLSVTWLPMMLLAWEAVQDGQWTAAPILALCAGCQWLPGYPEFPMATAVLLVVVAALDHRSTLVGRVALVVGLVLLGVLLAGAHVVPVAETVAEGTRTPGSEAYHVSRFFFAVHSARELVEVSIRRYGGAGVLCLLLGLFGDVPQRRGWAAALVVGTFIMNPPLVYLFEVWPFSGLRYGYGWNAIVPFFAGCLAAAGVARLRRAESDATPWLAPAVCLAVAALALRTGHRLGAAAAVACAAATWLPVRRRGGWVVPIVLVGLHAGVVLSSIGTGLRPAPDPARVATRIPVLRRAQEQLGGRLLGGPEVRTGVLLTEHLPSAGGYEPGNPPRRVERLTRVLGLGFLPTGTEVRRGTWSKIAANPGIAAALGIGLIAVPPLEATPLRVAGYESLLTLPDGDLLLYRPAAPRFQVLGRIVRAADEEESFRLVTSPGFDATAAVVLEEDPPFPILSADGSRGAVRVLSDAPERIELRATLTSPSLLVIADTYFPGWQARVDGTLAPLLRANYAFRAVALESGQHDVVLVYAPRSFRVGVALSIAGLALTAGLWLVVRRRAARGVPPSPGQFACRVAGRALRAGVRARHRGAGHRPDSALPPARVAVRQAGPLRRPRLPFARPDRCRTARSPPPPPGAWSFPPVAG